MEVEGKKKSGSRLFELALNDAIQSRLSLVSPVRILMEKEKMEKRKAKRMKSKISIQTDTPEKKSNSLSSEKFLLKNWKKTKNSNSDNVLKNEYLSAFSNNTKKSQVKDGTPTGIIWNLGDIESGEENYRPNSRRSSLLNDFECLWIPEENDGSSDVSNKSISIDLNSPEWNKIESKCVSRESDSKTSIDYDLPVFPLSVDPDSILNKEPSQKSFFDDGFNLEISNLSIGSLKNSSETSFPPLKTPGLEFLQQSVVSNNFIPPPRVMKVEQSYSDETEIPAPYMPDKIFSKSCKSLNLHSPNRTGISEKSLRMYGSEAALSYANNENTSKVSKSLKFDEYLTLRHFKSMLPENCLSESFENVVQTTLPSNYPINNSHIHSSVSNPHTIKDGIYGNSYDSPYKSNPNFSYIKKGCSYGNPSGLLEHFPEFKGVM